MCKACNLCDGDSQVSLQDFEIFFSSRLSKEPEKILPHAGAKSRDFSINSKEELWGNDNDSGERRGVHGTGLKITSHLWLLLDVLRHNPRHPGVRLFIYDRNSLFPDLVQTRPAKAVRRGTPNASHIIYLQLDDITDTPNQCGKKTSKWRKPLSANGLESKRLETHFGNKKAQ